MAVDMQQLQAIHHRETEIDESVKSIKALQDQRSDLIEDLDEYKALEEALATAREARVRLKIAIRDNRELARVEVEAAEERFRLRDLREILSHHLVVYTQDTGRDVVKDREAHNRQIELRAKLGKWALDQVRLPLGINRHLGQHIAIPEGMKVEASE